MKTADVVICGAGIAGISVAWQLAVKHGMKNVVLVDERPPMTLTSDKIDRSLPQLVARSRRRHGAAHEPKH